MTARDVSEREATKNEPQPCQPGWNARDVIASFLFLRPSVPSIEAAREEADELIIRLDVCGFNILRLDENHWATKRRCIAAVEAEQLTDNIDVPGDHAYRLAINDTLAALRALPDGGVE